MNREKFIEYLGTPDKLDGSNTDEIRGVLQEYPYFQTAHMLLVKALDNLKDLRFNNQLKISAAHIGNRHILFNLVNHQRSISITPAEASPGSMPGSRPHEEISITSRDQKTEIAAGESRTDLFIIDDKADIITTPIPDSPLQGKEKGVADIYRDPDLLEIDGTDQADDGTSASSGAVSMTLAGKQKIRERGENEAEMHSFYGWLERLQTMNESDTRLASAEKEDGDDSNDLIGRFLREKPRIEPRSPLDESEPPVDMSAGSTKESDEFFTETLARVYIQQKHYKKAIYAYEKLCLKYPEKYSYFADQIDEIKRIINQ